MSKFLYYLFLVSAILFGSISIGPFTIRVFATIVMVVFLFINRSSFFGNKLIPIPFSYISVYLMYLLFFFIALVMSGDIDRYDFFHRLIGMHGVCIVAFCAVCYFVNDKKMANQTCMVLLAILLVDSVVTIFQYLENPIAWAIGGVMGDISQAEEYLLMHDDSLGASIMPGILGGAVSNAFYIAVVAPLSFLYIYKSKILGKFAIGSVFLLSFFASYVTQQRASFGLLLVFVLINVCYNVKRYRSFVWLVMLALMIVSFFIYFDLTDDYWGRLTKTSSDDRKDLISYASTFVFDNWLWGGPIKYVKEAGVSAHNIIIDSIINAGIFGFIFAMLLYFGSLFNVARSITISFFKKRNISLLVISFSMFICLIYGLFHNASYITGDVLVFIMLALFLKSKKIQLI